MNRLRHAAAIVVAVASLGAGPIPVKLVSNLAVYDVSLDHTSPGSVAAARGRTAIEFRDVCTGWQTTQRFIADMLDSGGEVSRTDYIVTAWESKDGRTMRFDTTDSDSGRKPERQKGNAVMGDAGGQVALSIPAGKHFALPAGTIFPTAHTIAIIEAARAGERSLKREVFQGGDETDLYTAIVTIGPQTAGKTQRADPKGLLKHVVAWPVLVSYFGDPNAETPDYEVASLLYANGVIGSMKLIYRHFTLNAELVKLEPLSPRC
jgi:EipB-like